MKRIYMVLSICLIVLGLVCPGCRPSATAQLEENKAIARRHFEEVWSKGNITLVDEHIATNFVLHDPSSREVQGTEGYKQYVTIYRTAFPDIHFIVEDQIAEGNKVATRWTATGTHQGELMGIPPTGKLCTVTGISIGRIAGGKIQESWSYWDAMGMLQQLGVVPPIAEGDKK
jgi:steroid delta-isomerase-like uncharacterized protein